MTFKETLWSIDRSSGEVVWSWRWQPRQTDEPYAEDYGPKTRLIPSERGLFWLEEWSPERHERHERTDLVRLSEAGVVQLHQPSSLISDYSSLDDAVCQDDVLFVRSGWVWESWSE